MGAIDKLFVLKNAQNAEQLHAFLKQNARAMAEAGKPLAVAVKPHKETRSQRQNRRHFGIITEISKAAWVDGQQFSKKAWHEHFAQKYAPMEEIRLPSGELLLVRKSTAEMDVDEFNKFMMQIEVECIQDIGIASEIFF
jgi:hypothetical protein